MRKIIFLFLILIATVVKGQYVFHLSNIYFENQKIQKISKGGSGSIWCIAGEDKKKIFCLDPNKNDSDLTAVFSVATSSNYTDIYDLSSNNIVVSTKNDFMYNYNNGILTHLDKNYGFAQQDNFITSIVGNKSNLFVGSPTHRYSSSNGINYSIIAASDTSTYFFTNCHMEQGKSDFFVRFINASGVFEFGYYYPDSLGKINVATLNYPSWDFKWFAGGKYGLYKSGTSAKVYLPKQEIFQFLKYTSDNLIIAADSGLYYVNNYNPPKKIKIIGLDTPFSAFDIYEDESGIIYVATNIGLLELVNTDCTNFDISFTTNKTQVNIFNHDEVAFNVSGLGGILTYSWNFGDGITSNEKNPIHKYTEIGNYKVSLYVSNGYCVDSAFKNIVVLNHPNPYPGLFTENNNATTFSSIHSNRSNIHIIREDRDSLSNIFVGLREDVGQASIFNNKGNHSYEKRTFPEFPHFELSAWSDYNNDGLPDMIAIGTYNFAKIVKLYKNLGNNSFEIKILFENISDISSLQWVDYDNDGLLDIFVGSQQGNSFLLHNENNDLFTLSDKVVFNNGSYLNFGSWADFDNDNDMDLFMLKSTGNSLYINNGDGTFSMHPNIPSQISGSTCSWADYDNDGYLELFITGKGNYVFENSEANGLQLIEHGILTDDIYTNTNGTFYTLNGTSSDWNDLDNNGYVDLIKYSGSVNGKVYMNLGNNIFYNDTSNILNSKNHSRGYYVVSNDMNNDGFVDIISIGGDPTDGGESHYFSNKGNANNYVNIFCVGTKSNRSAIGAKVYITTHVNGKFVTQLREIECMTGKRTQKGFNAHFGLADALVIDTLRIVWPSGIVTESTKLNINKIYTIIEPWLNQPIEPYCDNKDIILSVPNISGVSYQWLLNNNPISDATNATYIAKVSGKYSVIINQTTRIDTTNQVIINILPSPEIITSYKGDTTICFYDSLQISVTGGINYSWLYNNSIIQNYSESLYIIFNPGSYYAFGYNEDGCLDTSEVFNVSFAPDSMYYLGNDTSICEGNSVIFGNELSGVSYKWHNGLINPYFNADTSGIFIRISTDKFGCNYTDSVHLTVNNNPNFDLGNNISICDGYYTVIGINNQNLSYNWSNGMKSNSIYVSNEGTYSLTVTNQNNCSFSDSIYVSKLPPIIVELGNDTTITTNQKLEIYPEVSRNGHFYWSNDTLEDHLTINGADYTVGSYLISLQVIDSLGCIGVDNINITVTFPNYISISDLVLYPNPTTSIINIDLNNIESLPLTMTLSNMFGQTIDTKLISNHYFTYDLKELNPGIYTLIVKSDFNYTVFKIFYSPM